MNNEDRQVPYIAHEGDMARMERANRRLAILVGLLAAILLITNGAWLWAWTRYDYGVEDTITTTVQQDGEGNNVYGNDNEVVNGTEDNNESDPE